MGDEAAERRQDVTERARFHVEAQRRRSQEESAKAQALIDRFVVKATQASLPTEELTARPRSGSGRSAARCRSGPAGTPPAAGPGSG